MTDELLSAALARATDALGKDDAVAAAGALDEAARACEASLRDALRVAPSTRPAPALLEAHARCCTAAEAAGARLTAALAAAAQARRAGSAYRR